VILANASLGPIAFQLSSENRVVSTFLSEINGLDPVLLGTDPAPLSFRLGD